MTSEHDEARDPMFAEAAVRPVVDVLENLADGGRVLEFAVGTGRIALPLAARGIEVHGIEISEDAVRAMQAKPGGDAIPVVVGDMASARVEGQFALVYLVFNTIMNLTTQAAQVACFRNAAAHLRPGGKFVVETMVPELRKLPPGERYVLFDASENHWGFDEYDTVNQGLISHHFERGTNGWDLSSGSFRYVWPGELDLMAKMAGMSLISRWADWDQTPYSADSRSHVSVWQRAAA